MIAKNFLDKISFLDILFVIRRSFMFGFGKKQNKSLLIMGTDVVEIIKSDYENDMAFTLIEFLYDENNI